MEEVFVARQPIFDRQLRVFGYELLFRQSALENFFAHPDPDEAASRVIHDSLHVFGLDVIAQDRRIFFNVTRSVLVEELVRILPRERTVVELLETVTADAEVIAACRQLKQAGYLLALDDFAVYPGCEQLLELADIVKVDFLASTPDERIEIPQRFRRPGLTFLAEKVETGDAFREAEGLGYGLFQGFFFRRPEILAARGIPAGEMNLVRLLQLAGAERFDLAQAREIVKHDTGLCARLLRLLNAPILGWPVPVTSLDQALELLGERRLRKWLTMAAVIGLGAGRPDELVLSALIRGRMCETLAPEAGLAEQGIRLFEAGVISALDALLGRPLRSVLAQLHVVGALREAIVGDGGRLGDVLSLAQAYEAGAWDRAGEIARTLGVDVHGLPAHYRDAVSWAEAVYRA